MNPDLLRQRRNLIAISSVLLIFDFADVKIESVSVLGTQLLVGNVQVLMIGSWILWAYFLLRYYQYWRSEPSTPIRNAFRERVDAYVLSYIHTKEPDVQTQSYKLERCGLMSWSCVLQAYNGRGQIVDGVAVPISPFRLLWLGLKTMVHIVIHTPYATDHVLPFVLAVAAPMVTIFTNYNHDFL